MSDFSAVVLRPDFALSGRLLVEASAGTGKTYNIQNAYLRLVLAAGLPVQNLLVVTFTEAATHELRARLRAVLTACRALLEWRLQAGPPAACPVPDDGERERLEAACGLALLDAPAGAGDPERLARVRLALMDFDCAAVFTIHGFCKRVLDRYAFECGHDPDAELLADPGTVATEVCRDWWRRHTYADPAFRAKVPFRGVAELERLVRAALGRPDAELKPDPAGSWTSRIQAAKTACREFEGALAGPARAWDPSAAAMRLAGCLADLRRELGLPAANLAALRAGWKAFDKDADEAFWKSADKVKHPLDDLAPGLAPALAALNRHILSGMAGAVAETAREVRGEIRARGLLTYDAMLLRVRDALLDPRAGARLAQVLRREFRAALIDEFQDTDPVQYDIFRRLFGEAPGQPPLVFVGDPKQAIYGFRGGDVFAYYAAREAVPAAARHTLNTNYRAERRLVEALNELFADPAGGRTFRNDHIVYDGSLKAHGVPPERRLLEGGREPDSRPFRIRLFPFEKGDRQGKESPLALAMYADVAREAVRLLADPGLRLGGRRPEPRDLAVLVLDHEEAGLLQQELLARGVNAVRQATGCVFDADEAAGLAHLLAALLEPRRPGLVRAALCQPIMPCSEADVRRFADEAVFGAVAGSAFPDPAAESDEDARCLPDTLEHWMDLLAESGRRWQKRSLAEGFRFLAGRIGLKAHVAGLPDGVRRLTDLLHLVELLHQESCARQLGPSALWRWFLGQLDADTRRNGEAEAYQTRLASDESAVRILTVFKSKGLQFPVVFVPTLWRRSAKRPDGDCLFYHAASGRLVLDLDRHDARARAASVRERFEEDLRLAYVALTRAVNRTYLWAREGSADRAEEYALDHLLAAWRARAPAGGAGGIQLLASDAVSWSGVPDAWSEPAPAVTLVPPERPRVDKTRGHASFTSLALPEQAARLAAMEDELRDVDALADADAPPAAAGPPAEAGPQPDIFSIPGGAKTGDCWHTIFENLDFQAGPAAARAVVDAELDRFRICRGPTAGAVQAQRDAVHAMVGRVLAAPLDAGFGPFALRQVPRRSRRSELAFQFSLNQAGPARPLGSLGRALQEHWAAPARDEAFLARLLQAPHPLPLGFMIGSLDLFFEHAGRFYIADWKSNRLSGRASDFGPAGLKAEMAAHSYYLQYLIYTVAADAFLRQVLRGYDYERHFGGVFYLFLRGVDGSGRGVFVDRPPAALIAELARALASGAGEGA